MKLKAKILAVALGLSVMVVGAAGTTAFAANINSLAVPTAIQQTQRVDTQKAETKNSQDAADSAAQIKITEAEAIAIAAAANNGYTFTVDGLGDDVYELTGVDAGGKQRTVLVDIANGAIVTEAAHKNNDGDNKEEQHGETDGQETDQSQKALAVQAKITEAQAIAAALSANSGYTYTLVVTKTESLYMS